MCAVRAVCVGMLAIGSAVCILTALLAPRTDSVNLPLLRSPLSQLTLDAAPRHKSPHKSPHSPRADGSGHTCYTYGLTTRGERFCAASAEARIWCARHTTPTRSRTSATESVWLAARPACCADGVLSMADGCPREYPDAPARHAPPPLLLHTNSTRKRGAKKRPAGKKRARPPTFTPE